MIKRLSTAERSASPSRRNCVAEKRISLGRGRMRYIIIRGIMERSPRRAKGFLKGIRGAF